MIEQSTAVADKGRCLSTIEKHIIMRSSSESAKSCHKKQR